MNKIKILGGSTSVEKDNRSKFLNYFKEAPIPDNELLSNLGLFLNRQTLSRILFMHDLYKKIINIHPGGQLKSGQSWPLQKRPVAGCVFS